MTTVNNSSDVRRKEEAAPPSTAENNSSVRRKEEAAPPSTAGNKGKQVIGYDVWAFLERHPSSTAGDVKGPKALCTLCGATLCGSGGHLRRHISSKKCLEAVAALYDDLEAQGLAHIE